MKRRNFLKKGLVSSAFFGAAGILAGETFANSHNDFDFLEWDVSQMQEAMQAGKLTSLQLTKAYLKRIETLNKKGPELRAVIATNPKAEAQAEQLDKERAAGKVRGPLHGIPILVKDNINTTALPTTAGSWALKNHQPKNAFIMDKLEEAGAILLGKANLSEWANFRSTRSSSGWSGVGGQCRNPYSLDRTPCGSSSGSGAAVAANLCAIAIGTETNGSIICPSSINGIVGIKPTVGLWSRTGIVPISHTQDTAGPMARTVTDAAVLLTALAGKDKEDQATQDAHSSIGTDFTKALDKHALKGARIGIARNFFGKYGPVDEVMDSVMETLKGQGATLVDIENVFGANDFDESEFEVLLYEFKHDLNSYLKKFNAPVKSLEELIAYNKEHAKEEMPWFGQELFEMAQQKGELTDHAYLDALKKIKEVTTTNGIDKHFKEQNLDAILAPSNGPAWTIDWLLGDHGYMGSSGLAAMSGYPNITVPAGQVKGMPIGVSFVGKAWSEAKLLAVAYAYEQASKSRIVPEFRTQVS
ncbi:amidase [Limibacter armeniacum]|uniref:amidase n=1 Tax=Limibacter armeniacum TaxID=466084 RepID=UPI002FE5EE76